MKKVILLFVLLPILIASCEQTKEAKAEKVIKKYLKETMDDYASYSPVSFSELTMVKTEWELPKELEPEFKKLVEIAEKINKTGYSINTTSDANYYLKDFIYPEEDYVRHIKEEKKKKETLSRRSKQKALWLEFKHYQDIIYASKKSFQPEFIGWKMTHKFRAKNRMGGTELNKVEFRFDKDITKVIKVRKL